MCDAASQKIILKNADQTRANEFVFARILDSTASQADTFKEVGNGSLAVKSKLNISLNSSLYR